MVHEVCDVPSNFSSSVWFQTNTIFLKERPSTPKQKSNAEMAVSGWCKIISRCTPVATTNAFVCPMSSGRKGGSTFIMARMKGEEKRSRVNMKYKKNNSCTNDSCTFSDHLLWLNLNRHARTTYFIHKAWVMILQKFLTHCWIERLMLNFILTNILKPSKNMPYFFLVCYNTEMRM